MMVANITPTEGLDDLLEDDHYHLILTNVVLADSEYTAYYVACKVVGEYVILDNDAHEMKGEQTCVKIDLLKEAISRVSPSEVVLPDAYGDDRKASITKVEEGVAKLNSDRYKLQAVPRGKDLDDYYGCVDDILRLYDEVDTIGVYYLLEKEFGVTRTEIVSHIRQLPNFDHERHEIHLLGEGANLRSLRDSSLHALVRGIDTAKLVNWGLRGCYVSASSVPPHQGRLENYFEQQFDSRQFSIAKSNIEYWRDYCGMA